MSNKNIGQIQEVIEYKFNNLDFLNKALTHKSYAKERINIEHNERLEFLGDSVLSLIISQILFERFPNETEGKLSKLKSQIVSAHNVSFWARSIDLGSFVFLGSNENRQKSIRDGDNLLCDAFEALLGAVFMDGGFESAKKLVLKFLDSRPVKEEDYKSVLQEIIQAQFKVLPIYKLQREYGPQHNKSFEVIVRLKDNILGKGVAHTKKDAEQIAACQALKNIRNMKLMDGC
ncbi:MAG: ribonuclease III [Elusimicrobiota bacterium]|jgi:ribonuclease-3|nr:ribonuclease III [Elusimicrobiota bacterium]